jgi:hypothetical protein
LSAAKSGAEQNANTVSKRNLFIGRSLEGW